MYFGHMGFFLWPLMMFLWIFFIILILWLILYPKDKDEDLLKILKEKYVKGEISKKEYEEKKKELEKNN